MILLQKYSGKSLKNCRVYIDYEKRSVRFDPTGDPRTLTFLIVNDLADTFGKAMVLSGILMAIGVLPFTNSALRSGTQEYQFYILITVSMFAASMATLAQLGKFLSKKWREEKFPVWNTLFNKRKKYVVRDNAIINNQFLIPFFHNVELTWEVTGDYAEQLDKITIEELFENKPTSAFALFHFKQKPSSGTMVVSAI